MEKFASGDALQRVGDNIELLRVITAMAEMFAAANRKRSATRRKRSLTT